MRAIVYLRVSTDKQKKSGTGLKRQLHACIEKAYALGIHNVYTFVDAGVSGLTPIEERLPLALALDFLQPGDYFIVYDLKRIARNIVIAQEEEQLIQAKQAQLISVSEPEYSSITRDNALKHMISMVKAEYERIKIIQETQANLISKKKASECVGTVPYGFKRMSGSANLKAYPEEQEVNNLVKMLNNQGISIRHITKEINSRGYSSRTYKLFQHNQIVNMLKEHKALMQPRSKTRQTFQANTLPYGFMHGVNGAIEPCPDEQQVIIYARLLKAQGLSLHAIALKINQEGYSNRTGKPFVKMQIARMFIERTNTGQRKNKAQLDTATMQSEVFEYAQRLRFKGYSFKAIAQELDALGYKNSRGHQLKLSSIRTLLKDMPSIIATKTAGKSNLPYGYQYALDGHTIEPCVHEQEIITVVKELDLQGYSSSGIARELTKQGYCSRAQKPFKSVQIDRICNNRQANNKKLFTRKDTHGKVIETL